MAATGTATGRRGRCHLLVGAWRRPLLAVEDRPEPALSFSRRVSRSRCSRARRCRTRACWIPCWRSFILRWLRVRLLRRTDIIASPPSRCAARHCALRPGCHLVYLAVIETSTALGHRKVDQLTIVALDTFAITSSVRASPLPRSTACGDPTLRAVHHRGSGPAGPRCRPPQRGCGGSLETSRTTVATQPAAAPAGRGSGGTSPARLAHPSFTSWGRRV